MPLWMQETLLSLRRKLAARRLELQLAEQQLAQKRKKEADEAILREALKIKQETWKRMRDFRKKKRAEHREREEKLKLARQKLEKQQLQEKQLEEQRKNRLQMVLHYTAIEKENREKQARWQREKDIEAECIRKVQEAREKHGPEIRDPKIRPEIEEECRRKLDQFRRALQKEREKTWTWS